MVIFIAMEIEEPTPGGPNQGIDYRWSPSFTHIDHALEHSKTRAAVQSAGTSVSEVRECQRSSRVSAKSTVAVRRRRRAMRRLSRSDVPPQTPWSMRFNSAYSRHGPLTTQSLQMRRATSTPTPSLGKKIDGSSIRHLPSDIHSVSSTASTSFEVVDDLSRQRL